MIRKHGLILGSEGGEQAGGALDIREYQGDGAARQLAHCALRVIASDDGTGSGAGAALAPFGARRLAYPPHN